MGQLRTCVGEIQNAGHFILLHSMFHKFALIFLQNNLKFNEWNNFQCVGTICESSTKFINFVHEHSSQDFPGIFYYINNMMCFLCHKKQMFMLTKFTWNLFMNFVEDSHIGPSVLLPLKNLVIILFKNKHTTLVFYAKGSSS